MKVTKVSNLVFVSGSYLWMAMSQHVMAMDTNAGGIIESHSIQGTNSTVFKDFLRVDSLNLYAQNPNEEILTLRIDSPVDKVYKLIDWGRANDRGTITNLKCDSLKLGLESRYLVHFSSGPYTECHILYYGNTRRTFLAFARIGGLDSVFTRRIESLLVDLDFKKDKIQANRITYEKVQNVLTVFAFKPFSWSEKIRFEYRPRIEANKSIDGEGLKAILNSYQIASGHATGIGQLLAIKDYIASGKHLMIMKWSRGKDVKIASIEQLRGFIQAYDPVIDIVNDKEFNN